MKKICMALMMLSAPLWTSAAEELTLDPAHSNIQFTVSHLMVSKVTGEFSEFSTDVKIEDGKLVEASATIEVDSIDTDNEKRDNHLKSADFFDAEKHPEITFESTKIEKDKLHGKLTIHGVTKEVALDYSFKGPVVDPWGNTKYGLNASTTIDRTEYGLNWNKALEAGGVVVGDEVEIDISLEFSK